MILPSLHIELPFAKHCHKKNVNVIPGKKRSVSVTRIVRQFRQSDIKQFSAYQTKWGMTLSTASKAADHTDTNSQCIAWLYRVTVGPPWDAKEARARSHTH